MCFSATKEAALSLGEDDEDVCALSAQVLSNLINKNTYCVLNCCSKSNKLAAYVRLAWLNLFPQVLFINPPGSSPPLSLVFQPVTSSGLNPALHRLPSAVKHNAMRLYHSHVWGYR